MVAAVVVHNIEKKLRLNLKITQHSKLTQRCRTYEERHRYIVLIRFLM